MRATDFIRGILDFIDNVEQDTPVTDYEEECVDDEPATTLANSPDIMIVPTDTILSLGNDVNKPKHPSDLRADSISMYPNMQYNPENR